MKSVFLCEDFFQIHRVYSENTVCALQNSAGLENNVYSLADLHENPQKFSDVNFIFSTWGMPTLTETEIKTLLPNLECVFYAAGTVQSFARPFLNCGVKVFSAYAANALPVAEYTVAQITLANKGFFSSAYLYSQSGDYKKSADYCGHFIGNYNAKIGIIGAGAIGKTVIKMLKSYNLDVMVFDPFLSNEEANKLGAKKCDLATLFRECNVISNHLADNINTKGMLNYALFSAMRPYATFINTGRGAQVVEDDLAAVLKKRQDLTAILDVTYPEPVTKDSPFISLPNCFLTPHIAGSIGNEVHRMAEYMQAECERYISHTPTKYEITEKMLETMA